MGKPRLPVNRDKPLTDQYDPIDLDKTAEEVINDVSQRLLKVFDKYGYVPSVEGWRALAVKLVEQHEKVLKTKQRVTAEPFWFATWRMRQLCKAESKKPRKERRTQRQIAKEVAPLFGLKPQTLEVRYAAIPDKTELDRYDPNRMRFPNWDSHGMKYAHALYAAPRKITLLYKLQKKSPL